VQTVENAERRTREMLFYYQSLFEDAIGKNALDCPAELLENLLLNDFLKEDYNFLQKLMQLIKDTSKMIDPKIRKEKVSKKAYLDVMKAYLSFCATDINKDQRISLEELKYLLFSFEGDLPTEFRVTRELELLDSDGSGFISK